MRKWRALAVVLLAAGAHAHPRGAHLRCTFTLTRSELTGLLALDVDTSEQARLLRAGADVDRSGTLEPSEISALTARLAAQLTGGLSMAISGGAIPAQVKDTKLSLRGDARASDTGLSLAVLIHTAHPHQVSPGMRFEVKARSPDGSHVTIELIQVGVPVKRVEAASGAPVSVRLE